MKGVLGVGVVGGGGVPVRLTIDEKGRMPVVNDQCMR